MERPEDFEERKESATEEYGQAETDGGASAATADEDRDREGRFGGEDTPQATSDTEERRTDA
jgi:hypothetical protein